MALKPVRGEGVEDGILRRDRRRLGPRRLPQTAANIGDDVLQLCVGLAARPPVRLGSVADDDLAGCWADHAVVPIRRGWRVGTNG